jgi:hypothetical protein
MGTGMRGLARVVVALSVKTAMGMRGLAGLGIPVKAGSGIPVKAGSGIPVKAGSGIPVKAGMGPRGVRAALAAWVGAAERVTKRGDEVISLAREDADMAEALEASDQ